MVPRVRKWFELVEVNCPAKISMYMCANACTIIGNRTSLNYCTSAQKYAARTPWRCTSCGVCFSLPQLMAFPYMLSIFLGNTIAQLTPQLAIISLFSTNRCCWQILTPPQTVEDPRIKPARLDISELEKSVASPLHSENLQECSRLVPKILY